MLSRRLFTIFCRIVGLTFGLLGALILAAQCAEWWSYGDWNVVSIRYVLSYFDVIPQPFMPGRYGLLDLPMSALLFGAGGLIAALGGRYPSRRPGKSG